MRATKEARVRTIADATKVMAADPALSMKVASILASRLDATSAVMVELSKQHQGKPHEQGLLAAFSMRCICPMKMATQTSRGMICSTSIRRNVAARADVRHRPS